MVGLVKLIASLIVRNERHRYLEPCIAHLLEFCDEVRILDDGSTDEWVQNFRDAWGTKGNRVVALLGHRGRFFDHEGSARQELLEFTLRGDPTHVLAIDADEFIADGPMLRRACVASSNEPSLALCMQEVWNASEEGLEIRQDGGWAEHDVSIVWRPRSFPTAIRIADRALACGRVPEAVSRAPGGHGGTAIFHFGWANRPERAARHERYVIADGGKYHAGSHLDSIMLPDSRIELTAIPWPPGLDAVKSRILRHAGVK